MSLLNELEERRPATVMGFTKGDCEALASFIRQHNIKTAVETGVCYGFSSTYILDALGDGVLVSIDPLLMPFKQLVVPSEFYDRWIPIQNYSNHCLSRVLTAFAPVDLFLHDSKHDYETMMLEYMAAHNSNVRFIASDDVGGPYCGTVWKDFITKYNYTELVIGTRARIATRK